MDKATSGRTLAQAAQLLRRSVVREGQPFSPGGKREGPGGNFGLFPGDPTKVEAGLVEGKGEDEAEGIGAAEYTQEVWDGLPPGGGSGLVYGLWVHGSEGAGAGHRFNPNKLVIDPYAKQLVGDLRWCPELFGYRLDHPERENPLAARDGARWWRMPRVKFPAFMGEVFKGGEMVGGKGYFRN